MLTRRGWITGCAVLASAGPGRAAEPLEVFTADVRPLSIADGERRGIVLDIVRDALRLAGQEARFTFLPFAEALARTQAQPGALMAPLARSPQREEAYAWVAKVLDVPQAMGTLAGHGAGPLDLEAARRVGRLAVVRGGVQESFLRDQGFANLIAVTGARDAAQAVASGAVNAWYATATEIALQFELIGHPGEARIGPTIQSAPVWLAANKDTTGLPVDALRAAMDRLAQSGAVEKTYRAYVPG